jgi:hypothetical protein
MFFRSKFPRLSYEEAVRFDVQLRDLSARVHRLEALHGIADQPAEMVSAGEALESALRGYARGSGLRMPERDA